MSAYGRTIRKLIGWGVGGWAGEVQKKIFAQGNIKWKKIDIRQLTPPVDNIKNFLRLENSPPPPPLS